MPATKPLSELVDNVKNARARGAFRKFIEHIRFPSYKNLKPNAKIDFVFPVTALVGANGCGKSSVLQALYGCPYGYSPGTFWFSTKLDPIDDNSGNRPYIIYGYRPNSTSSDVWEVLKTRIKWEKKGGQSLNPDYWEPSRPLKSLGMKVLAGGKRHPAIDMQVMAIDFRYQLSAFDRYFYLEEVEAWHTKKKRTRQDVLRLRSAKVFQALESQEASADGKAEKVKTLNAGECEIISFILGKQYRTGRILRHRYYGFWADTVVFECDSLKYTEANAGSGEIAVALLVHRLRQAERGTLVLLDEPEYSLHPGAQKNLLHFILSQSLEKQLQIIFTTHSPAMIDGLPSGAIKVFEQDRTTGAFEIYQDRITEEAFISIGHSVTNRTVLRVEDALAKEIVETLIRRYFPPDFAQLVEVCYYPGGVGRMKEDAVLYSQDNANKPFIIFDGTENFGDATDPGTITPNDRTLDKLKSLIKDVAGQDIPFPVDGGSSGGRTDQQMTAMEAYLRYWRSHVFFLPFNVPEDEVWNDDLVEGELKDVISDSAQILSEKAKLSHLPTKQRFAYLANTVYGRSKAENIITVQSKFVRHWIKRNSRAVEQVKEILDLIRQSLAAGR